VDHEAWSEGAGPEKIDTMGNPTEEREVFRGFLSAMPLFAAFAVVKWEQTKQDPPDVEADLADGGRVGIELTSWLEESQIGREKRVEIIEDPFRDAINPDPTNQTEHIFLVWIDPKRRMEKNDAAGFRSELLALMEEIDNGWSNIPYSDSPQGFPWKDFVKYPTLAKYLNSIDVHPRGGGGRKGGVHWLTFPIRGGAYSPDWMVDALVDCISAKTTKYSAKPTGFEEFHLLVHYDKTFVYNSPVFGIDFGLCRSGERGWRNTTMAASLSVFGRRASQNP
jgi:hypothetical protein